MDRRDDVAYCADSCGRPATKERRRATRPDGQGGVDSVVELVCDRCYAKNVPAHRVSG